MTISEENTRLSSVQIQSIREELHEQLLWRTNQLSSLKASMEAAGTEGVSWQDVLADIAATDRAIAEIRQSIANLEGGDYGRCTGCGARIPFERLKIRPLTRNCVACQRRHEMR
ncbi:TraR/DksA family transcriptional regulator [Sphaerisporangium perillae]|uniref:TraR/DksA family transcriptional regulator n=1 Tax=Sphaerisporangium perillae TaxID=2935860 RepID=UPI002010ADD9|nr:TraR/DksA C4-type zinc finger protein [Sphaerisporangium perillae]